VKLEQALNIAREALAEGERKGFAPLTCVVLDRGGNPVSLLRADNSSIYRAEIAVAKAAGCLGMGFGGRELARRAAAAPMFFNGLQALFPKGILPVPGGVLVKDSDGSLLGAVGVSGDTSDNDEIAALAGIAAAGLTGDSGG
jgi:uncharacterized protein GlcG (DUF336 family)